MSVAELEMLIVLNLFVKTSMKSMTTSKIKKGTVPISQKKTLFPQRTTARKTEVHKSLYTVYPNFSSVVNQKIFLLSKIKKGTNFYEHS